MPVLVRLATLLTIVVLSACTDDPKGGEPDVDDGLPSDSEVEAYFAAAASYDPDQLEAALDTAAPASVAEEYAGYLLAFSESAIAGGNPVDGEQLEVVEDGFSACGGTGANDECVVWSDMEGERGELVSFTVNGQELDPILESYAEDPAVTTEFLRVQPRYSYRSPQSGRLFVLVSATAGTEPVVVLPVLARHTDAEGAVTRGDVTLGPSIIAPRTTEIVTLAFPDAEPTGSVRLLVSTDTATASQRTARVDLPIR